MTLVMGGNAVKVRYFDGIDGTVYVKAVKISEMEAFFKAMVQEVDLIKMCTDLSSEAIDGLTADSTMDILEEIDRINFPNAKRWAARRARALETLLPNNGSSTPTAESRKPALTSA